MKHTLILLLALSILAGCDYPEAGFYEITVADKGKQIAGFPFMIEELTDDTDLTIGFNLLLPRGGELVLVPLKNSMDLSRRGWDIRIGSGDSGGYGDLQLALMHSNDQLSFSGVQRDNNASQSELFRGKNLHDFGGSVELAEDNEPSNIKLEGSLPAALLDGKAA
ncbi:MAG: hypothetical protein M3R04_02000, partial [bacterium]|nr:hypothetical protein [bacterium]